MPRFVLLYHDCPPGYERPSHWDFMLEEGGKLRTWVLSRLPKSWMAARMRTAERAADCPAVADGDSVPCEVLGDHRLAYLELEGALSGDRGSVRRIDAGTFVASAAAANHVEVVLSGELIRGGITIEGSNRQSVLTVR